jgi:hypothetical protein
VQRSQSVATSGKWSGDENREIKRKPLPWVATGFLRCSMVRKGRRFESARGLCNSLAKRLLSDQTHLHDLQRAVRMEPFMELSGSKGALRSAKTVCFRPRVEVRNDELAAVRFRWDCTEGWLVAVVRVNAKA